MAAKTFSLTADLTALFGAPVGKRKVTVTSTAQVVNTVADIVYERRTAVVVTDGSLAVTLPALDADNSPTDFGYQVAIEGWATRWTFQARANGATLDLADVTDTYSVPATPNALALIAGLDERVNDLEAAPSGAAPAWTSVTGKPAFALVATSGAYGDLSGLPSIPSIAGLAATTYVNTQDTAVLAAAATDATSKANAAQTAAVQRANHTGTQSADTLTDGSTNKAFLATERTKLAGVATSATANSGDATLLARANHTGTQAISTVTGLQAAIDAKLSLPPTTTLAARAAATGSLAVIFVSDVAGGQLQQDTAASTWTPLAPGVSQGGFTRIGGAAVTANVTGIGTTTTDVSGLSYTWTAVTGATYWVFAKFFIGNTANAATTTGYMADSANAVVDTGSYLTRLANDSQIMTYHTFVTPAAGSTTYKARLKSSTGTGAFVLGDPTFPARLDVFKVG